MTLHQAFLQDIAASPDDDGPRLIYADWLDDHGEPERAEFIRAQCEAFRLPEGDPRRHGLDQRAKELEEAHAQKWLGPLWEFRSKWGRGSNFRRGLPLFLYLTAGKFVQKAFQKMAVEWFPRAGIVRLLLRDPTKRVAAVFESPVLGYLTELSWSDCKLEDEGMELLARCPYLANLTELTLEKPYITDRGLRSLGRAPHLSRLQSLSLEGTFWGRKESLTAPAFQTLLENPHLAGVIKLRLPHSALGWGMYRTNELPFSAIPALQRLRELDLSWCALNDRHAEVLAQSPYLANLKRLDLSDNSDIGDQGARALIASPYLQRVEWLGLESVLARFSEEVKQELRDHFGSRIRLYEAQQSAPG
jgi:uncharacterized protein (TIGR02996 family)